MRARHGLSERVCLYPQILRKSAFKIVSETAPGGIHVDTDNLQDFVGKPIWTRDRLYPETPAGVVTGLAWTPMGGSVLFIETTGKRARADLLQRPQKRDSAADDAKGSIELTGQLGDVMKESVKIAHTFATNFVSQLAAGDSQIADETRSRFADAGTFLRCAPIHIHVPDGAVPKVMRQR